MTKRNTGEPVVLSAVRERIMEKLYPSRKKIALMSLGPLLLTLMSLRIASQGVMLAWFPTTVFALCFVLVLLNLLPEACFLLINDSGFTIRTLSRNNFYRWTDIDQFGVSYFQKRPMVGFNCSIQYERHKYSRKLNSIIFGSEILLPDNYGLMPQELSNKLNFAREEALKKEIVKIMLR